MAEANTFDLQKFDQALLCVHQLLDYPDMDASEKAALQRWWTRRSAKLNRQLMQFLPYAATAQERLSLRLASILLQPQQPGVETRLKEDVEDYSAEISKQVISEFENITGDARRRRTGRSLDVVEEQIRDLDGLVREIRSVVYAWKDAQRTGLSDGEISSSIENLRTSYLSSGDASLSMPSNSVIALLSKLTPLKEVVAYVDDNLTTAYRDDSSELWAEFEQKLVGYRDPSKRENWIQPDLRTHVSYRWINETRASLKANREQLKEKIENIVRYLKFQNLEAAADLVGVFSRSGEGSDEQVVRTCILAERQRTAIIRERSVLELAHEDLIYIREHATLEDYRKYTEGTAQLLIDGLSKRLVAADALPRGQNLSDYLDRQIKSISDLRSNLLPIVGGDSGHGESTRPLMAYRQVYEKAVGYARSAKFDKVDECCDESENQLAEVIANLEMWLKSAEVPVPGMVERLRGVARQEAERLKTEKQNIAKVRACIATLEGDYLKSKEKFESNLAEWNRRKQGSMLGRFRRTNDHTFRDDAIQAFCECQERCPDAEWVRSWVGRGVGTLDKCENLDEKQWIERYFAAPPAPGRAVSS